MRLVAILLRPNNYKGDPLPRWAERINTAMVELEVDAKALATYCKVSLRSVYWWRSGEHPPGNTETLKKLCSVLRLDFDAMLKLIQRAQGEARDARKNNGGKQNDGKAK
jgi:transcriptional regulator with XRE-family HTH domain